MNMKRMLVNGNLNEIRVALVETNKAGNVHKLYDLDFERGREKQKGSIYYGEIVHLENSLDAAFVKYGAERNGFLPFKEIALTQEQQQAIERGEKLGVSDVVRKGQQVLVQIEKEERGNKGAALTTFISLAGCYLVLMPNNPGAGGISRRIDGDDRQEMKEALSQLTLPEGMGIIIRTAGVGRSVDELQWDLDVQLNLWAAIQEVYKNRSAPFLVHQESDVVMRSIRDYLRRDISEILIDNIEIFERAKKHIEIVRPDFMEHVKLYQDTIPLFTNFHIESQIESAYQREVRLPSGGAIVIDHTEALVSIDINSAKSVRGFDIEATALHTNLEAAEEIARQLRLRDIGGLVVIDFIDMGPSRNQREVENCLREATKMDRARIQIGRLSRFGLLEMSRQRLRPALGESSLLSCPRCHGSGVVRGIESLAASIMRLIEEHATKEKIKQVRAQVPVDVSTYLLNEKRDAIAKMEHSHRIHILIIPNIHYIAPHFKIDTVNQDTNLEHLPSYHLAEMLETELPYQVASLDKITPIEVPALKQVEPPQRSVKTPDKNFVKSKKGMLARLWDALFVKQAVEEPKPVRPSSAERQPLRNNSHRSAGAGRQNGNGGQQRGRRISQGLSVKDVVKQQNQERTDNKNPRNAPSSQPRVERNQEPANRRERKPRSVVAPQEDIVVIKIPSQQPTKTEFIVKDRIDNSTLKSPLVIEEEKPVMEVTKNLPIAALASENVIAEPVRGEDIFAKAQKMLAAQTITQEVPLVEVATPAKPEISTRPESQQQLPLSHIDETSSAVVTDQLALEQPVAAKKQERRPHRNHQRMHGKGRNNHAKKPMRVDEKKTLNEIPKPVGDQQ